MLNEWFDAAMLMAESQQVVALRLMKISRGGTDAGREMHRMVEEKIVAAGEAADMLMRGADMTSVIRYYRGHVGRNARRLSRD